MKFKVPPLDSTPRVWVEVDDGDGGWWAWVLVEGREKFFAGIWRDPTHPVNFVAKLLELGTSLVRSPADFGAKDGRVHFAVRDTATDEWLVVAGRGDKFKDTGRRFNCEAAARAAAMEMNDQGGAVTTNWGANDAGAGR